MSQQLVNLSPDLLRLRNEGYELEIRGSYLLISHVPYVDSNRSIQFGTLVSVLELAGDRTRKPKQHIAYFIGSHPCHKDGSAIAQIQHGGRTQLADDLVVDHSFSNKPANGYDDYYHKMTRYIEMISAPAWSLDDKVRVRTFRVIPSQAEESVFNYLDTNSSRAEIAAISDKLKGQRIGIIGLGGTGSYVLDLVAKTSVSAIHLFDADEFAQHNAFRSPGAPSVEELRTPPWKTEYFAEIYGRMRRGIHSHREHITQENVEVLADLDFIFINIDEGRSKEVIVQFLEQKGKSFIDVGMGLQICDDKLIGMLRVTASTPDQRDEFRKHVSFADKEDDVYSTNIQIAELNMLNASLAVIKWKKFSGFYQDLEREHNCVYSVNVNQLLSE